MNRGLTSLRKIGLLGGLYLAQGLPFGFFTQSLPVLLRKQHYTLGTIGLTSLLYLPWGLKFLWAPLVDRFGVGALGRRRTWILATQGAMVILLLTIAQFRPEESLTLLLLFVFLVSLFSATQDIATDGLALDALEWRERGIANAVQVAGYRVGMIVGGGVLLIVLDRIGWSTAFITMALLIFLTSVPVVFSGEMTKDQMPEEGTRPKSVHFLKIPGSWKFLVLVSLYKFGDEFATGMIRPFFVDLGLTLEDIGKLLGTIGFVAGLLGAVAGGLLVNRLGRKQALIGFGIVQIVTLVGYVMMARTHPRMPFIYAVSAAEHLASGMATATLFTCMMDWCRLETSATDYTVQASTVVIARACASSLSGYSAERLGYFSHFIFSIVLSGIAILIVAKLFEEHLPQTHEQIAST